MCYKQECTEERRCRYCKNAGFLNGSPPTASQRSQRTSESFNSEQLHGQAQFAPFQMERGRLQTAQSLSSSEQAGYACDLRLRGMFCQGITTFCQKPRVLRCIPNVSTWRFQRTCWNTMKTLQGSCGWFPLWQRRQRSRSCVKFV